MGRTSQRLGLEQEQTTGGRTSQRLGVGQQPVQQTGKMNTLKNFGIGALRGVGSTLVGLEKAGGQLGGNLLYGGIKKILPGQKQDVGDLFTKEQITPKGTAQKAGFVSEQIGEFLIPASKVAKFEKLLDVTLQGSKLLSGSKLALGATKVGAKALTEAAVGGTQTYAQTGDLKESGKSALLFGATRGVTGTIGEIARGFGIPEKLYSRIFKTNYKDMLSELKAKGIETFAKTHPEQYIEFVKSGVIKTALGGKKVISESLAQEALDRGLKGSLRNMADTVVEDTIKLEDAARSAVKASRVVVELPNQGKLADILKETGLRYANVGDGRIAKMAEDFSNKLMAGKLNAREMLKLRRFLDGMRTRASFDPQAPLSLTQENFKFWANTVRGKLSKVKGLEEIMKDYGFNIEALESLAREASRRGNAQIIGLIDSLFLGGGIATGEPLTGVAMNIGRRMLNSPRGLTGIGQAIQKSGPTSKIGTLIKAGVNQITRD